MVPNRIALLVSLCLLGLLVEKASAYYHPPTGRFLSRDPVGYAGSDGNLQEYVSGRPVSLKDPFGTNAIERPLPNWTINSEFICRDRCERRFGPSWPRNSGFEVCFRTCMERLADQPVPVLPPASPNFSDCEQFVETMLHYVKYNQRHELEWYLWHHQLPEPDGFSGFQEGLVFGGQGTDVYRHLQCCAASEMNTGVCARGQYLIDFSEVVIDSVNSPEDVLEDMSEMIGDGVGAGVGALIEEAIEGGLSEEELEKLREDLRRKLCDPKGATQESSRRSG